MAKQSAKDAILITNGYTVQTVATAYKVDLVVAPVDVTAFTEPQNFTPGIRKAEMAIEALWNSDSGSTHAAFGTLPNTGNFTILPQGYTLGYPALTMAYMQGNYSPAGAPTDALKVGSIKLSAYGADSMIYNGVALTHGSITNTTTGTGVLDPSNAAQTAACGGTLHIWGATTTDTYVIKIQHSSDNSSWADLVTFTLTGAALGSERIAVASGTVNKYRRVLATRTGSAGDTLSFSVIFFLK